MTDASKYVVFCARRDVTATDVQRHLERIAAVRQVSLESLEGYRLTINGLVGKKSPAQLTAWVERQVYIALGFMMNSAAVLHIDTCAIEGMDPAQYEHILHMQDSPYYPICGLALGYRDQDADKYARLPKVRFDRNDVIKTL